MDPDRRPPNEESPELDALLFDYIDRLNAGEVLDPEAIARDHPAQASALLDRLEVYRMLEEPAAFELSTGAVGDYRLLRRIGRGGMGVVYEAWQDSMDRRVALKVLPAGIAADPRTVSRFVREAQVAGSLHHPNVVGVYGMGVERNTPYYAMELVEGETLAQRLKRLRIEDVDPQYCLGIASAFAGAAEGLQHAHSKGVVHRDVKPSNLIFDREGSLRILDFGLARLEGHEAITLSGDFLGTPQYMSPEQARRKKIEVDHRTDIYSLGATLYEALTLRPPFRGKDPEDTLSQIIDRDPIAPRRINPRASKDLETIVLKCLSKEPAQRYGTAEALAQDLRRFVRGDPIEARPEAPWERLRRRISRHRGKLAASAAALALAGLCALLGLRLAVEARKSRRLAEEEAERTIVGAALKVLRGETTLAASSADSPSRQASFLGTLFPDDWRGFVRESGRTAVEEALRALVEAAAVVPERAEGHYWRGRALRLLGREREALRALDEALRRWPDFAPARALRCESIAGAAGAETDASGPEESPWGSTWLLAHSAATERRWMEAAAAYGSLIALDEDLETRRERLYLGSLLDHLLGRGIARLEIKDFEGAERDFWAARTISRRDWSEFLEPALLLGKTYCQGGKTAEAESMFQEVFARTPPKEETALWIAAVFRSIGRDRPALDWAKRVTGPVGDRLRAGILADLGQIAEALEAQRRAAAREPDDADAQVALGRHLHIDLWKKTKGQYGSASRQAPAELRELAEVSARALALAPRSPAALILASDVARVQGEVDRAHDLYRRAAALAAGEKAQGQPQPAQSQGGLPMRSELTTALIVALPLAAGSGAAQDGPEIIEFSEDVRGYFEVPVLLGPEVNSPYHEWSPSVTSDETEIFFASLRRGRWEVFTATRTSVDEDFRNVRPVDEILTGDGDEINPWISRDGLRLYFNAGSSFDSQCSTATIYVATRDVPGGQDPFGAIRPLATINETFPGGGRSGPSGR